MESCPCQRSSHHLRQESSASGQETLAEEPSLSVGKHGLSRSGSALYQDGTWGWYPRWCQHQAQMPDTCWLLWHRQCSQRGSGPGPGQGSGPASDDVEAFEDAWLWAPRRQPSPVLRCSPLLFAGHRPSALSAPPGRRWSWLFVSSQGAASWPFCTDESSTWASLRRHSRPQQQRWEP